MVLHAIAEKPLLKAMSLLRCHVVTALRTAPAETAHTLAVLCAVAALCAVEAFCTATAKTAHRVRA